MTDFIDHFGQPIELNDVVIVLGASYCGVPNGYPAVVTGFTPKQVRVAHFNGDYKEESVHKTTRIICFEKFGRNQKIMDQIKPILDGTAPSYEEYNEE